jgi:hypothetical protein
LPFTFLVAKAICATTFFVRSRGHSKTRLVGQRASYMRAITGAHMPAYQNQFPPHSLSPGAFGFSFNNETPTAGEAGSQFALPNPSGFADGGRVVAWQTIYATAPSAVSLSLQAAMDDVASDYATIDTSTNTAGESRTVTGVRANFLRVICNSITGGARVTAKILP